MERLVGNELGPHESWSEYAEHSLTHDDLPSGLTGNAQLDLTPGNSDKTPADI